MSTSGATEVAWIVYDAGWEVPTFRFSGNSLYQQGHFCIYIPVATFMELVDFQRFEYVAFQCKCSPNTWGSVAIH
eukprot:3310058-Amphidinium_carterae.2